VIGGSAGSHPAGHTVTPHTSLRRRAVPYGFRPGCDSGPVTLVDASYHHTLSTHYAAGGFSCDVVASQARQRANVIHLPSAHSSLHEYVRSVTDGGLFELGRHHNVFSLVHWLSLYLAT
jgi:hypothetical protein